MPARRRLCEGLVIGLLLMFCQGFVRADVNDIVVICNSGSPCTVVNQSSTGLASGSSSLFAGTASGSADATGGILHASASYSFPSAPSGSGQVNANAQFFDEVTIDAPGLSGATGYLVLSFHLTGTTSGPADALLAPLVNCTGPGGIAFNSTPNCQLKTITGDSEVVFDPIAFTFGTPNGFDFNLAAEAFYGPSGPLQAASNFSDTALLNGIGVFLNSNGTNPVSNLSFSSADGITYTADGIVPEPSLLLFLAAGFGLLCFVHRKRAAMPIKKAVDGPFRVCSCHSPEASF